MGSATGHTTSSGSEVRQRRFAAAEASGPGTFPETANGEAGGPKGELSPAPTSKEATPLSTEEALIDRLDAFLSRIEHRLELFDQYFKERSTKQGRRRWLESWLESVPFSAMTLTKMYDQLVAVKDLVLRTSVLNMEYLYKALDDRYELLFGSEQAGPADGSETAIDTPETADKSESDDFGLLGDSLTEKILTTLTFFEQKLGQLDRHIQTRTSGIAGDGATDTYSQLRFFNFNRALKAAQDSYIHYYQLPLSWRENRYIIYGYRFQLLHRQMLKLMFHFNHNESGNIWTHMGGLLAVAYLAFVHFPGTPVFAANAPAANAIVYVFLAAAATCLALLVLWHTYLCFARLHVRNRFACIDYTGITVLITCLVVAAEYASLSSHPRLLMLFMACLVVFGCGGFLFNWLSYFDKPECRPLRIGFFVLLALLGSTTFLCKWYYDGFAALVSFFVPLVYKSFAWYGLGVVFYGGLIPERWRYDIVVNLDASCLHSHNAVDVITGNIEHAGKEELEELAGKMGPDARLRATDAGPDSDTDPAIDPVLARHFPAQPTRTPYHKDFFSLWWVDYICLSHNIWHICVVLGVVGHYFCILGMFEVNNSMLQ